jgi:hypothetical protein
MRTLFCNVSYYAILRDQFEGSVDEVREMYNWETFVGGRKGKAVSELDKKKEQSCNHNSSR